MSLNNTSQNPRELALKVRDNNGSEPSSLIKEIDIDANIKAIRVGNIVQVACNDGNYTGNVLATLPEGYRPMIITEFINTFNSYRHSISTEGVISSINAYNNTPARFSVSFITKDNMPV